MPKILNIKKVIFTNSKQLNISTGTVGAISEYIVSAELLSLGLPIFRALSVNCFCDIVVVNNKYSIAIEIRTGNINLNSGHGSFSERTKHNIDIFAVYFPYTKKIYYKSVTKLGKAFIKEYKLKKWIISKKLL